MRSRRSSSFVRRPENNKCLLREKLTASCD
jgi:hypothetical protein